MVSSYTLNFFLSGVKGQWGTFYSMGLLNFGIFECDGDDCHLWEIRDLGRLNKFWAKKFQNALYDVCNGERAIC